MSDALNIWLEDIHGNEWHLSGEQAGEEGAVLEATEVIDVFDEADVKTIRDEGAFSRGSFYAGKRVMTRYPVFDVGLMDTASQTVRQTISAWRRGWSYDADCKLYVQDEESTRYIELRKLEKIKFSPATDYNADGIATMTMVCVSGNPFFREDDVVDSYVTTTDTTVSGTETGQVTIANPCDVDIWLQWIVQGGATGMIVTLPDFSFGNDEFNRATEDDDRAVILAPLQSGEVLLIDTDKLAIDGQFNSSTRPSYRGLMNGVRFMYRVPAGTESTDLPIVFDNAPIGAGVQVRAPRNWWAAQGGETP